MKSRALFLLLTATFAVVLSNSVVGLADDQSNPIERYKLIIDHSPFGVVNPPQCNVTPPEPLKRFVFVGLASDVTSERILAIIQDREKNRVYYRSEGETFDGVKVTKIDRPPPTEKGTQAPKLTIQQGLDIATLEYQVRTSTPLPATMSAMTPMPVVPPTPVVPTPASRAVVRGTQPRPWKPFLFQK